VNKIYALLARGAQKGSASLYKEGSDSNSGAGGKFRVRGAPNPWH